MAAPAPYNTADGFPLPQARPGNPQGAANARALDATSPTWGQRLLGRVIAYAMRGVDGPSAFFSPQQPLLPVAQPDEAGALGRTFDYPSGYNTRTTPRLEEPTSFGTLKALADGYDVLRTIIETRKDQVASMQWTIAPKVKGVKPDARCEMLADFWSSPDREHSWHDWLRMLMEQLFVIDAPALYCRMTRGGDLYALEVLDGATFARKLTLDGRTPDAFEGPAYQQVLKGLPAVDYIKPLPKGIKPPTDQNGAPMPELIYRPRNLRVDRVYGFSPVEQIITTVNIALRREIYLLNYYTEGSSADLLFGVPDTWNPNQIVQFQTNWDAMLAGNLAQRRKAQFIPGGVKPFDVREKALTDQADEWLTRICCFAFSIAPTPFIKQMNRATADNAKEMAIEEGLGPIKLWISDLVAYVHRVKFGIDDLVLKWEESVEAGPTEQAAIDVSLVNAKIYHPDEIRNRRGDDPMPDDLRAEMDLANFNSAANSTILPDDQQAAKDQAAQALAAAKPAPVVAPPGSNGPPKPAEKVEHRITVEAPQVHIAPAAINIAPAAVNVTTPPVTVNMPEIRPPDVFVDVGATNVQAKFEQPKRSSGERTVAYERDKAGNLVAKVTESTTRTIRAARDAEGKLIAKADG